MTTRSARHVSAEDWLLRASRAEDSLERAKYATRGLAKPALEPTLQGLLLRQLYMAHLELERLELAIEIAEQVVALHALDDVAHQDLARAYLANKQYDAALGQVRLARRVAPPERKAFHDWTQGSMLYLLGRWKQAVTVFERGLRWSVGERPLIEAQLGLTRLALDDDAGVDLDELKESLEASKSAAGYGRFVLGELNYELGDEAAARRDLRAFVERTESGRVALRISLALELEHARKLLGALTRKATAHD